MPTVIAETPAIAPIRPPALVILAAWLIPGAGHFWLGRRGRAAIVFATVLLCFVVGVSMNGPFFSPTTAGDMLSRVIQYGGFLGDVANGVFYFIAALAGYGPPDQPGHVPDYGSKFLVGAGLLNILAIVDAYEIALRQKD